MNSVFISGVILETQSNGSLLVLTVAAPIGQAESACLTLLPAGRLKLPAGKPNIARSDP